MTTKKSIAESLQKVMAMKGVNMGIEKCLACVNTVFQACANSLANGENVRIDGFGQFKYVEVPERPGRNPKTGEAVTIPAHKTVRFTVSKTLKDSVNI